MAIGKNKRLTKGKKGGKKKLVDPLTRKDWFDCQAPAPFDSRSFGKTCITKTTGTKIATECIKGRIVEASLADLKKGSDHMAWRKVRLCVEDVEGRYCRTSFYGLDMTRDKLCQFVRKWQSLIEANFEVKTQDGYILRLFVIGFTRKTQGQICKTSYAKRSQVKTIRKKITDYLTKEAATNNLTAYVKNLITDAPGEKMIQQCQYVFPLANVLVRKVKLLKKPKLDSTKFNELFKTDARDNVQNVETAVDKDAKADLLA